MRITRHRQTPPDGPPSADLRLDDGFLDLPLALGRGAPPAELTAHGRKRRIWPWMVLVLAVAAGGAGGYYLHLGPPLAELSPASLEFGQVRLGTTSDELAVTVGNSGERVLAVARATLVGEAGEFALAADGCSGREVTPGRSCVLRLAFTPSSRGPRRARLELATNTVEGGAAVALAGEGVAPELRAGPAQLDFGDAVLGAAGRRARLRLSNHGSAALALRRVDLEGLAAADFVVLADACSDRALEPGKECTVQYRFVPTAEGLRRARVTIASDAPPPESPPWLVGMGLPREPLLRLEPERLDFGARRVGTASPVQVVTVHNVGDAPLEIRRWSASVAAIVPPGGEPPAPTPPDSGGPFPARDTAGDLGFALLDDGCTGRKLAPGAECAVEIGFRPLREGEAHGFFEVEHSARRGSHALAVSGTGTAPHADVDPVRVTFGEVAVATRSLPRRVRLVNSGTGPLEVRAVAIEGADRQAFSPPDSGCTGAVLAAGASCTVEVRFRPLRDGPHRAELVLRHSADGGRDRLPLNGLGVSARLEAEPGRLDFGSVRPRGEHRQPLVLTNRGRAAVEIRRLSFDGAYAGVFALAADGCSRATLAPGESCRVTVRVAPDRPGTQNAILRIDHGAAGVREVAVTARSAALP